MVVYVYEKLETHREASLGQGRVFRGQIRKKPPRPLRLCGKSDSTAETLSSLRVSRGGKKWEIEVRKWGKWDEGGKKFPIWYLAVVKAAPHGFRDRD